MKRIIEALLLALLLSTSNAQTNPSTSTENSKYFRNQPGSNGEYFDTRTMRWYTRDGQPCSYCTPEAGYNIPIDQIGQGPSQARYAFVDGYFFSPYDLAWFDRNGECLRCDPSTGFWIPDEFAQTAEYRKERRRFAQLLTGITAPLPDGRPASAPRAGQGFGGFANTNLPLKFDGRQMRWVDQNGQVCGACTPENGFWIPPQFANEIEYRDQQVRYTYLVGTMRKDSFPNNTGTSGNPNPVPIPGGNPNPYGSGTIVEFECAAKGYSYKLCRVDTGRGVSVIKELIKTKCVQNQTWGFTREGIWVDRGCAARFGIVR